MKTYMAQPATVQMKWYVVDATGMVLGRLASQVAAVLRGKNLPDFTPNVDTGNHVIVINCDKVILTGKKLEQKMYRRHSNYPGGLKEMTYEKLMATKPEFAVFKAIKGMLPHNTLGSVMISKLKVYSGSEHNHQAQMPVELKFE